MGNADPSGLAADKAVASALLAGLAAGGEGPAEQAADKALEALGGAGEAAEEAAVDVGEAACNEVQQAWDRYLSQVQQLRENAQRGANAERDVWVRLNEAGRNLRPLAPKQAVNTPWGRRYPDIVEVDDANNVVRYWEVKSGNAIYSALQRMKDAWIGAQDGGAPTVVIRR